MISSQEGLYAATMSSPNISVLMCRSRFVWRLGVSVDTQRSKPIILEGNSNL